MVCPPLNELLLGSPDDRDQCPIIRGNPTAKTSSEIRTDSPEKLRFKALVVHSQLGGVTVTEFSKSVTMAGHQKHHELQHRH
jgi:hypothetical protein